MAGAALRAARRQARAEAAVKYNPEQRVLIDALASAQSNALGTIQSARGGSSALRAAINRARPGLKRGYRDAAATATAARGDLIGHLDHLGAAAVPFSAAVAREQAGVTSRAAQERANALGELSVRAVQAREGGLSAELNARRQLAADQSTIFRQLGGIASDRGAFTASAIADIRQAQRVVSGQNQRASLQAQTTRRGQNLSHQDRQASIHQRDVASRRTAASKSAARNAARRGKPLSDAQSQKLVEHIGSARSWIGRIHSLYPGKSSTDIRALLASGGRIQTGTAQSTTATGKTTSHATFETVPAFGDPRIVNAAYDLHVFNALSPANQRALRRARLPGGWLRWHHPAGTRVLPDVRAAGRAGHAR